MRGAMIQLQRVVFVALCCLPFSPLAAAQGSYDVECGTLVRSCIDSSDSRSERDTCLYSALQQPTCQASTIEPTLQQRWSLSANPIDGAEGVHALLGDEAVNHGCVDNCDTRWLGMLINSAAPSVMRKTIESCLDACVERPALPFFHP